MRTRASVTTEECKVQAGLAMAAGMAGVIVRPSSRPPIWHRLDMYNDYGRRTRIILQSCTNAGTAHRGPSRRFPRALAV